MLSRVEWRDNRRAFILCLLSALLGASMFPALSVRGLAWIALVPLLIALPHMRGKGLVWGTYIFGFAWHYISLFWLNTLIVFHGLIPVGILIAAAVQATYFLAFTFPANFALRRFPRWLSPFAVAVLWTAMEYLRSFTDIALPWNYLGHSQIGAPLVGSVTQWADIGGVYIVSALAALSNTSIAELIRSWRTPWRLQAIGAFVVALVVFTGAILGGWGKAAQYSAQPSGATQSINVALIQPNISQLDKWESYDPATTEERRAELEVGMVRKQFAMMQQAFIDATTETRPRLFILPETAVTEAGFVYDEPLHREFHRLAQYYGADIFFGADNRTSLEEYKEQLRRGFRKPAPGLSPTTYTLPRFKVHVNADGTTQPYEDAMAVFNSAWLVTPERGLTDTVYNKVQLVPFGETAPLVNLIPYFQEKVMMIGSFQRGLEFTTFETAGIRYGALICFESAFAPLARGLARSGARIIVVLTNDAWYDPAYAIDRKGFWGAVFQLPLLRTIASSGPHQHYVQSLYRAIETRLPVVRVANTGVTAIIEPDGSPAVETAFGEQAIVMRSLKVPSNASTFYVRHGDLFAGTCLAFLLLTIAAAARSRLKRVSGDANR